MNHTSIKYSTKHAKKMFYDIDDIDDINDNDDSNDHINNEIYDPRKFHDMVKGFLMLMMTAMMKNMITKCFMGMVNNHMMLIMIAMIKNLISKSFIMMAMEFIRVIMIVMMKNMIIKFFIGMEKEYVVVEDEGGYYGDRDEQYEQYDPKRFYLDFNEIHGFFYHGDYYDDSDSNKEELNP